MNDDDFFNEIKRREQHSRDGRSLILGAVALFFVGLLLLIIIGDRGTVRDPLVGFMGTIFSASLVFGIWGVSILLRARR